MAKCPECGSEALTAVVTIKKALRLAKKGGNVAVGGSKVTQVDLKDAWTKDGSGEEVKIRGPIFCGECGSEMYYLVGSKSPRYFYFFSSGLWQPYY